MRSVKNKLLPYARTLTERLRLQLEKDILDGRLKPGTKLDEEEIAAQYGLSRTPVREAFKALSSSGLVEVKQHYGAFVSMLTLQRLNEMLEFMCLIEIACAEMAALRATETDKQTLLSAQEVCERAVTAEDAHLFYDANVVFHNALYDAAHNEFLSEQARQIRIRLEPYRRKITFDIKVMKQSTQEHEKILKAIFDGFSDQARSEMKRHVNSLVTDINHLAKYISLL